MVRRFPGTLIGATLAAAVAASTLSIAPLTQASAATIDDCEAGGHPFTDVEATSFAAGSIACIFNLKITTGTSPTTYGPRDLVTREQMAAFLARAWTALGRTCADDPHPFTDVGPESFAFDAVGCIFSLRITTGTSSTTYGPKDFVTREQMAAFLARLWNALGANCDLWTSPFDDVAASSFAHGPVACIEELGITTGTGPTTYSPGDFVTREQMAAFLARLLRAERFESWSPSPVGDCEIGVNVSPTHRLTTASIPTERVVYEPGVVFRDETFTMYRRAPVGPARVPFYVENEDSFVVVGGSEPEWGYDDGTHGDLVAGDGVFTRACLSVAPIVPSDGASTQLYDLMVVDPSLRDSETPTAVRTGMRRTDTALFVEVGSIYGNRYSDRWSINGIQDCVACAMAWDEYGSIFDVIAVVMRDATGGAGFFRVHDFIDGVGHDPDCAFDGYCYDVIGPEEHPELIGLLHMEFPNLDGLVHELGHGLLGVNTVDFPEPGERAWNAGDGFHFDSDTTLGGGLAGPLWDPARGYPYPVHIEVPGDASSEVRIHRVGTEFRIRPTEDADFLWTPIELYMLGLLSAAEARDVIEYKLVNPTIPGCGAEPEILLCPAGSDLVVPESVVSFSVDDLIDRYGPWGARPGYTPESLDLGVVVISDRPATGAEIVYYTIASREIMGTGTRGDVYDDYTWHYVTGGRSELRTDLYG